jgi:L-histidine Nalpha-methyltransferase
MTSAVAELTSSPVAAEVNSAVALEARHGLSATPKTLSPWLFYDEAGSRLFEQITTVPEYYLTRTERDLFATYAGEIFDTIGLAGQSSVTIAELGAGTASKTGILLQALTEIQPSVLYQPIDISPTALDEACDQLQGAIPSLTVRPHVANYVTEAIHIHREPRCRVLALYIGSSIGNFSPGEARAILSKLRAQLRPGDHLLLGTDLAPSHSKPVEALLAAYDDAAGVTAAFNRNVLNRLNRDLDANFDPDSFAHQSRWNAVESRIEMHLESACAQTVRIPANDACPSLTLHFAPGETIHTENSHKFTPASIAALLADCDFAPTRTFSDPQELFAVTLAAAV